jgi:uncharacterized RmlC-like cupin family protein
MDIQTLPPVHLLRLPEAEAVNRRLLQRFSVLREDPATRRTHFLHGRYENLYIDRERVPEILPLIQAGTRAAATILGRTGPLRCGFWFNWMGPGHRTSLHTHEERDELLSAVYYVTAPAHCGDLVLDLSLTRLRLSPSPGLMVLFPPDVPHEVDVNRSGEDRLSVAFNFGPA